MKNNWNSNAYNEKGGSVEETLLYHSQHAAKFKYSFPFTLSLSFEELAFSLFESLGVNWDSVFLVRKPWLSENTDFAVCWELYIRVSFSGSPLAIINQRSDVSGI